MAAGIDRRHHGQAATLPERHRHCHRSLAAGRSEYQCGEKMEYLETRVTQRDQPQVAVREERQLALWDVHPSAENADYLSRQLISYLGNKRALLGHIGRAVERVKRRLGKNRLCVFDAFAGSGIVSRFFKAHASLLISNDIEDYATVIGRCYLRNKSTVDLSSLRAIVEDFNARVDAEHLPPGFIEELYAPRDEQHITAADRVFYTKKNARRLDNYRRLIDTVPAQMRELLLGPLLSEASIHANTAGVFKGFYKNRHTGVGQFGGTGSDALARIMGEITLEMPVLSNFECEYQVLQDDANAAARRLAGLDLAYIDPPYNQHPYGSNYFMLNLLVQYQRPQHVSRISGIPRDWRRSGYNSRAKCLPLLRDLLENIDAPFLLISFNNEGFIAPAHMRSMLADLGRVEVGEIPYNAFRGSRNFEHRPIHVTEQLFLVERR
ncbi:MAG: DNA adenine methylase [Pirellulales bacterium]|nr:DNA adenine methylase [Pirellulales bacterium]